MNTKQTNKLASYTATEAVLKAAPEIATVPGLPENVERLSARIAEINRLGKTQTEPIRISMARRDQLLGIMTETTLEIAGIVATVAREQSLPQLAQAVHLGRNSFRRVRRAHRAWLAQRVLEAARSALAHLGGYGVTAERLDAFAAQIVAASEGLDLPRTTDAARQAATGQLSALFKETDALLKDGIDRLVFLLRKTSPEFFRAYRVARSIVDRPAGRMPAAAEQPGTVNPPTAPAVTPAISQNIAA